jgi:hypothetical protein
VQDCVERRVGEESEGGGVEDGRGEAGCGRGVACGYWDVGIGRGGLALHCFMSVQRGMRGRKS